MPVEETENEIRVRVEDPGDFRRIRQIFPQKTEGGNIPEELKDHWPYNKEGVRGVGGPMKRTGDVKVQAYAFSKEDKYDWTPSKAEKWVRDQGETPKGISYPIDPVPMTYDFELQAVKSALEVPKQDRVKVEEGVEVVYIEGMASTNDIDRQGDEIEQYSIEISDFMRNPVLLYMHNPDWDIGKVVRLEPDMSLGENRRGLFCRAAVIGVTEKAKEVIELIKNKMVRAFSVNGKWKARKRLCSEGSCHYKLLGLNLAEISVASVPANQRTLFNVAKGLLPRDIDHGPAGSPSGTGETIQKEETEMVKQETPAPEVEPPAPKPEPAAEESPELLQRLEAVEAAVKKIPEIEAALKVISEKLDAMTKPEPEVEIVEPGDVVEMKGPTKKSFFVVEKGADKDGKGLEVKKMSLEQKKELAAQQWEAQNKR